VSDEKHPHRHGHDHPKRPEPVDDLVVTHHTLRTTSGEIAYTARAGRIVLREEEVSKKEVFRGWKARAELSVTAYTLDTDDTKGDLTTRPITFVFNGGPGSSSVWLHMGLLGPRRVDVGDVDAPTPPPYGLLDNAETLLAASDLVFIDPMSTGHSRAVEGRKARDFHGYAKDVEQVSELIRLWCTREDRWMSPKYLIGESYGTVRAVAVAERLSSTHALALNGIVLVSSVLDFGSQDFGHLRHDEASLNFLPTYAAIAHYHGLHEGRTLDEVRAEAEEFAAGPYRTALARGQRLGADERAEIVSTLARLAGVSEEYVDRTDLRIEHWRWCTEVLRERGLAVGRIDGRYTGPLYSRLAENMDADPSSDAIEGPFSAALHHYLRGELGSTLDIPYEVFANAIKKWSFAEFEGKPINVADKLERLMRVNPHLRVRIEYGYYDLATPYHASEDMVAHLRLPEEAFDRIEHEYFETGHMPYLHEESRVREATSIARFVTGP
jgi:carboxypeptidase C (cathepsin A)